MGVNGLGEVGLVAGEEGADAVLGAGEGGEGDGRDAAQLSGTQFPQELIPILSRHADVADDDVRPPGLQQRNRMASGSTPVGCGWRRGQLLSDGVVVNS